MVRFRSSLQKRQAAENFGIPPTEVGGWFRSNLFTQKAHETQVSFVCARPRLVSEAGSEQSTNCRWWDSRTRFALVYRLDLNHPPTSVGGIPEFSRSRNSVLICRGVPPWAPFLSEQLCKNGRPRRDAPYRLGHYRTPTLFARFFLQGNL